jgi:hypothetical protein
MMRWHGISMQAHVWDLRGLRTVYSPFQNSGLQNCIFWTVLISIFKTTDFSEQTKADYHYIILKFWQLAASMMGILGTRQLIHVTMVILHVLLIFFERTARGSACFIDIEEKIQDYDSGKP